MKLLIALCVFGLAYAALPACRLKPETGLCRGYFPRYYYDPEDGTCKKFIYGGCGGNGNSFETEEECLEECKGAVVEYSPDTIAICHLMPETGMCLAYIRRYYYNAQTKRCQEFIYGGCQGNANNFETLKECEQRCVKPEEQFSDVPVCEQDAEPGKCLAYMPRYFYNKHTGKCERFIYGGCGGNENNFKTLKECEQECGVAYSESTCQQEKDPGPCRAFFPRYYYDSEDGVCKKFVYGGCEGNDNNFETQEECELTCESQRSSSEDVCSLEQETGPCKAYFHRFYFNKDSGKCEGFIYGGCRGNANNFKTLEECERTCPTSSAPVDCTSEPETGLCEAYFRRYFYDKITQTCKEFVYGGCGGNGNNYKTREECLRTCA